MGGERDSFSDAQKYDVETTRQDLADFVRGAEFGSVRFTALSDYINVREARATVDNLRDKKAKLETNGTMNEQDTDLLRYLDSELRIQETVCANFLTRTQVNKDTVPGYKQDYDTLGGLAARLGAGLSMQQLEDGVPPSKHAAQRVETEVTGELRNLRAPMYPATRQQK